jgi:hypothetical protein
MSVESPAKHEVAARLLRSSQRLSLDPTVEVDWDARLDPTLPAFPLHRATLYGTPLWESMTQEQRVQLSWHELASFMSVGLWFELCLMQALLRHAYDQDPHAAHAQYALTEIGDETRHSIMFARAAEALAPGARYRPSPLVHSLGRLWKTVAAGPSLFASVLVAEETLDRLQRECLAAEGLLPLAVEVSRIHVTEEARHVSYARAAVARSTPRLGPGQRLLHSVLTVVTAGFVVHSLIDPRVYQAVGLDRAEAVRQARRNPHRVETRYWMAEKVVAFLSEHGIVTRATAPLWRRLRLLR